jgi:hypothetical protein
MFRGAQMGMTAITTPKYHRNICALINVVVADSRVGILLHHGKV